MALNDDSEPYGADGVLVIQAPQGCGKTFFCRKIAMKSDWFAEGLTLDLDNKDSIIQATGKWISELGELDSTLKREQSALKAFLTSSKDTYRLPYAKVSVNKPRRTSFCATVNPKEFLNDDTGSRRYWVVQPTRIDIPALINLDDTWLRQLWSQVYHTLYLEDPQGFRLTEDERKKLQKENEQYSKPLPGEIEIIEEVLVPVITLVRKPDNITYCFVDPVIKFKMGQDARITLFSNMPMKQPRIQVNGIFYDGAFVGDKKHAEFIMPELKRTNSYEALVLDGDRNVGVTLSFSIERATKQKNLFGL